MNTIQKKIKTRNDVYIFIKNYFIEEFEIPETKITLETNLYQDLELDSIDAFNMAGMLEMKLDLEIEDDELKNIITIKDIIDHIVWKIKLR